MGTIYSILIPAHGGEDVFFRVDHERLTLETVLTLYAPSSYLNPKSGRRGYEIVHGVHPPLILNPDTSRIMHLYEELREQLELVLDITGDAGQKVKEKFAKDFPFADLMESLAARRFRASEEHLQTCMYALISLFSELLQSLDQAEKNASGFLASAEGTIALIEEAPEFVRKEYEEWVDAAQHLIIIQAELSSKEEMTETAIRALEKLQLQSDAVLADSDSQIADARAYLDGNDTAFIQAAYEFSYKKDRDAQDEAQLAMAEMADMARLHRDFCHEREEKQKKAARGFFESEEPQRQKTLSEVQDLLKRFREQTDKFRDHFAKHQKRNKENQQKGKPLIPLPFEYGNAQLISREEYEQAERIFRDLKWGPKTAEMRVVGLLQKQGELLRHEPALSLNTRELLTTVERLLAEVADELLRFGAADTSDGTGIHHAVGWSAPPLPAPAQGRLEVLYELALCVGYELSRKNGFLCTTSVSSIMETILHLSPRLPEEYRFSTDDIDKYREAIANRIKDEKEFIKHKTGESTGVIIDRLEHTTHRWISYNTPKNLGGIKLAKHSWDLAKRLMEEKFSITVEDIRSAYDAKRAGQEERAKKRKDTKAQ